MAKMRLFFCILLAMLGFTSVGVLYQYKWNDLYERGYFTHFTDIRLHHIVFTGVVETTTDSINVTGTNMLSTTEIKTTTRPTTKEINPTIVLHSAETEMTESTESTESAEKTEKTESAESTVKQTTDIVKHLQQNETDQCPLYVKPIQRTITSIQQQRLNTMVQTCRRVLNNSCYRLPSFPKEDALFTKNYMLAVCEIQKCGSSSWRAAMFLLDGWFTVEDYRNGVISGQEIFELGNRVIRLSQIKGARERQQHWDKSFKILTVRHPFERLVSGYKDKISSKTPLTTYYAAISRDIWARYHTKRTNMTERNMPKDEGFASFEDFVNSLVENYNEDSHFRSYFSYCHPCSHDYDYIIKFETLHEDVSYLKEYVNMPDKYKKAIFEQSRYFTLKEETRNMLLTIPKALGLKLYKKYELDFIMFGYDKPDYLV